ncbi:MAG: hypothetical protein NT175_12170 [Bacteroidetes bacterium]|nr:hypothetical protein [Bacteroidota bacterium]
MKTLKNMLLLLILIMLFLPALQKLYPFFDIKALNGDFVAYQKPKFTWVGWFPGINQAQYTDYLEQNIGFRNALVRFNNQIDFSLFRRVHAEGVVVGKKDVLFEYDYIREYMGWDFIGEKTWDKKMRRFKYLQEFLKTTKNIDLILVLEPSKARFEPENLPDQYNTSKRTLTNYDYIRRKADELGIRYVDMNAYYLLMKDTTRYLLYPKYGVHWSTYGMTLVADTLIRYLENLRKIKMPDIYVEKIDISDSLRDNDYDAGRPLNLIWELPHGQMAYPKLRFEQNPSKIKPRVLVVGDSYFWNIYNTGLPASLFSHQNFWYFNYMVFPETYWDSTFVNDLNIRDEIERRDVVLLMVTERFLYKYDWEFIDRAYEAFTPDLEPDYLYNYENGIRINVGFFDDLVKRALKRSKPLQDVITQEADYQFKTENPDKYREIYGLRYYEEIIRSDTAWMNLVKNKAKLWKIPVDSALQRDADYMFNMDTPEIRKIYYADKMNEGLIRSDKILMAQVTEKAKQYYLTSDEMVRQEAVRIFREETGKAELEKSLDDYVKMIRNDQKWLNIVKEKASKLGISLDEMLRRDAQWMYDKEINKSK